MGFLRLHAFWRAEDISRHIFCETCLDFRDACNFRAAGKKSNFFCPVVRKRAFLSFLSKYELPVGDMRYQSNKSYKIGKRREF